jgi:hypothetical protein
MKPTLFVGTDTLLASAKRCVYAGIISEAQYEEMKKRNEKLSKKERYDTLEVKE